MTDLENDAIRYKDNLSSGRGSSAGDVAAARRAASSAAAARQSAADRVDDAQDRLDAASRLVADAAAAYESDAQTAITRLGRAYEQALAENSVWEKIRSSDAWQVLVTVANVVAVAAGFIAILVGGPFALLALLASVVLLADALLGFATGDGSWIELISAAVAFIPGGVFLKMGKGITKLGLKIAPKLTTAITGALAKLASKAAAGTTSIRSLYNRLIQDFDWDAIPTRPTETALASRLDNWAESVYDVLRSDRHLASRISANVREMTTRQIKRALNNVLFDKHLLGGGVYGEPWLGQFDASPKMADAFLRLIRGEQIDTDLILLRHEYAESMYWVENPGVLYSEAHEAANRIANWAEMVGN